MDFKEIKEIEKNLKKQFDEIENIEFENSKKVLKAFQEQNIVFEDFLSSNGYGIDERGRNNCEKVFAKIFKAQDCLVRSQIISGTHALAITLFGLLRPNQNLMYISGMPYDTLQSVIGVNTKKDQGSLKDYGIGFKYCNLKNSDFDYENIKYNLLNDDKIKVIAIQRSCGYEMRNAIDIKKIQNVISFIKSIRQDIYIMVDNCYGEFVEQKEPIEVGANVIVGSLMKNPGGGIAQTGGYIAGDKILIEQISNRLTAPGVGREIRPSLNQNSNFLKGIYLAPHIVANALKTMVFASYVLENAGYKTYPKYDEKRSDIVQKIEFGDEQKLIKFCQGIQSSSPIDSNVVPYPAPMGGYEDEIIMASGTFTQGSTIELSCDGPLRKPYVGYMQGSLTYDYGKIAILNAIDYMEKR